MLLLLAFIGFGTFLLLIIPMVPGTERGHFLLYGILSAPGCVGALALIWRIAASPHSGRYIAGVMAVSAVLLLAAVGLRQLYEFKYDRVPVEIPASNVVSVQFDYHDVYAYRGLNTLYGHPHAWLTIGGKTVQKGQVTDIPLNATIQVKGTLTFALRGTRYTPSSFALLSFTADSVRETHSFSIKCETDSPVTG